MSLYQVTADKLEVVARTTFAAEKLLERKDLQRLLRRDISPIGDDLLVIAEEYGDWEDSNRRIDLLCLSKSADLVVVEIKRTEDGGHMELQAIRYAAMVSSMTLPQVIEAFAHSQSVDSDIARRDIAEFLQIDDTDEPELTGEVRIILVSADFSTEVTTAVLWLNKRDLDITCIRLRPYRMGTQVLIEATQIVPLPEAAEYEVKLRAQEHQKRRALGERHEICRKFWTQLIERSKTDTQLLANRTANGDHWISAGIGRSGFSLNISLVQNSFQVECYIRVRGGEEKSTAAFRMLLDQKAEIETAFGGELDWQELEGREGCRIAAARMPGGWKSPEAEWAAMQEQMIGLLVRLEAAVKKPVLELKL